MSNETSHSTAQPLTSHSSRITDRVERECTNQKSGGRQTCGMAGLVPPPTQKRWSSVDLTKGPCLLRLHSPDRAWSLPRAALLLADRHLSLSIRERPALVVRPCPQDRGRAHRDSTRLVLPESGRGARSRRGLNSWRTVTTCLLFSLSAH